MAGIPLIETYQMPVASELPVNVAGWQADPIRVAPLSVPDIATETANLQARRLAKLFFLNAETAATIARLAYGCTS